MLRRVCRASWARCRPGSSPWQCRSAAALTKTTAAAAAQSAAATHRGAAAAARSEHCTWCLRGGGGGPRSLGASPVAAAETRTTEVILQAAPLAGRRALHAAAAGANRSAPAAAVAAGAVHSASAAADCTGVSAAPTKSGESRCFSVAAASRRLAAEVPPLLLQSAAGATAAEATTPGWCPLRALWRRCVQQLQQQQVELGEDDAPLHIEHIAFLLEGCFTVGVREFAVVCGLLHLVSDVAAASNPQPQLLLSHLPRLSRAVRRLGFLDFAFFNQAQRAIAEAGPGAGKPQTLNPQTLSPNPNPEGLDGTARSHKPQICYRADTEAPSLWSLWDACHVLETFAQQRMPSFAVSAAAAVLQQQQEVPLAAAARLLLACAQLDLHPPAFLQQLQQHLQQHLQQQQQQHESAQQQRQQALAWGAAAEAALLLQHFDHHHQQQQMWMPLLVCCLSRATAFAVEQPEEFWRRPSNARLHRQTLLCRLALRTLHREVYEGLEPDLRKALRQLQRIELTLSPRPPTVFVQKFSAILTKLRVAHQPYAMRGVLCFDLLERDRKLAWACDGPDRFYVNTNIKTATVRLHEKIARGLGIQVAHCAYWQWNKMKARRTRIEFVRMSRYYALQDRRETDLSFEGWLLPHVHHVHKQNQIEAFCHFPSNQPLGYALY
ncbi:hypothetical protein Esti_000159 [Eimeria stiedai]